MTMRRLGGGYETTERISSSAIPQMSLSVSTLEADPEYVKGATVRLAREPLST